MSTNKRQKFSCDPYLLEKKDPYLELVRVNYFLAFPWKPWNYKGLGNDRKMMKNTDIIM